MRDYLVEVRQAKRLFNDLVWLVLRLRRPGVMAFRPGQFVFFKVGGAFKAYSMAAPPKAGRLQFLVKLRERGLASRFLRGLRRGEQFEICGPEGNFFLPGAAKKACCLAAGVGVAPFLSMLPAWLKKGSGRQAVLIQGASSTARLVGRKKFSSLTTAGLSYLPVSGGLPAMEAALKKLMPNLAGWNFYLCGSRASVSRLKGFLLRGGVLPERVHEEAFG